MKIYLAGKITGMELLSAQEKFRSYEFRLKEMGFTDIVNPLKISPYRTGKIWSDYMRDCIRALCDCNAIALMPCWKESKGARLEKRIARNLEMQIIYLA